MNPIERSVAVICAAISAALVAWFSTAPVISRQDLVVSSFFLAAFSLLAVIPATSTHERNE